MTSLYPQKTKTVIIVNEVKLSFCIDYCNIDVK
jgi:hypothetical protein